MEELTTGQKLLTAVQGSEDARQERCSSTLAAKMKEARDKLQKGGARPKHPGSHLSAFGSPVPQVHGLLPDAANEQPRMTGIQSMLVSKKHRHDAAWQQYQSSKEVANQQHQHASAAAAASLTGHLKNVAADIENVMSVLAKDKVMVLDEQQIQQVWDSVAQRCATTAGCIDALGANRQAAEAELLGSCQTDLQSMVLEMCEIAHLDEGRIQRLLEQEAMTLNMEVLDNRQVTADMLQQLHAHEVLKEQSRRQHWESSFAAWRTLRSQHAVQQFCQMVKREWFNPSARLHLFVQLQANQGAAHTKLVQHCRKLGELVPPHLASEAVQTWVSETKQWSQEWHLQMAACTQQLQQQEDQLEQQIHTHLQEVQSEVLSYKGYTAEEVDSLLQQEVEPVLNSRRTAAAQLMQETAGFLERQAAEWQLAVQVLGNWLTSLVALFEDNKARIKRSDAGIKATLKAARQEFEQADQDMEAALDAAMFCVTEGSSEKVLDERVEVALRVLSAIEAGYRAYTAVSIERIRQYPGTVKQQLEMYRHCLCGLLHVQPVAVLQGASSQQQQQHSDTAVSAFPPGQEQQNQQLEIPQGSTYMVLHDLWTALLDSTEKPWLQHLKPAATLDNDTGDTEEGTCQPAAAPAAATPGKLAAATNGAKLTAKQQAEAAAASAAAEAAAAAAAAEAKAAQAAAYAAAAAFPACPVSPDGTELCQHLPVPTDVVVTSLQQVQVSLLGEMESSSSRIWGCADTWAESVEQSLTEELDSRLRAHRPRAGRIEEEVRAARTIELVAQRRRVEKHMSVQSKAVREQLAEFDDSILQLHNSVKSWVAKIQDYERLLANALSLKGIDIVWREAQALKAKQDKQLQEQVIRIEEMVASGCAAVIAANKEFGSTELKSLEEGGQYAPQNVAVYKAGLAGIDNHMTQQQRSQQQRLAASQEELSAALTSALATIEHLVPSYKQDMTLIETLNKCVEGAKKRASLELSRNTQEGEAIETTLQQLQSAVARAAGQQGPEGAKVPAGGAEPGPQGAPVDLEQCQELLSIVDRLRQQVWRQAQVLELLQSTGFPNNDPSLRICTELQPLPLPDTGPNGAAVPAAMNAAAATNKGAGARPGTGQKGTKPVVPGGSPATVVSPSRSPQANAAANVGADGAAQATETASVPLSKDISAVIEAAKQEVETVAKAYYGAKEANRVVRYPAKIAGSQKELMAGVCAVLQGLQQMLQCHIATAAKQLRMQVVQIQRLLERVPAAVIMLYTNHLLTAADQQRSKLLEEFAGRRQLLDQQLEQNKRRLQPSMLHPGRRLQFEVLRSSEANRQAAAADLTASCARTCLALITSQGNQVSVAVEDVSKLLLNVFDGIVMPADLVLAPEGDDALTGLQQRTVVELQRLALAQREAEPAGPATASAPSAGIAAAGKAAGAKPAARAASGEAAGDGSAVAARPFPYVYWKLTAGNLNNLGWSPEDQQAVMSAATPAATPTIATQSVAGVPPSKAAAASGPPTSQQVDQLEGAAVVGYDTPCQRAIIRSQRDVLHRTEQSLTAAVNGLKQQVYQWVRQEQLWCSAWATMIEELDTV